MARGWSVRWEDEDVILNGASTWAWEVLKTSAHRSNAFVRLDRGLDGQWGGAVDSKGSRGARRGEPFRESVAVNMGRLKREWWEQCATTGRRRR